MGANAERLLFTTLDAVALGVGNLERTVSKLAVDVSKLEGEVIALRAESHDGFDHVDRRFVRPEARIERIEDHIRSNDVYVYDRLVDHERRITALD